MTLEAVFVFKNIFGDQVYVSAPLTVNVLVDKGHTVELAVVTKTGKGLIVIAVIVPLIQPLASVPATV